MKKDEKQKQVDALHAELAKARSIISCTIHLRPASHNHRGSFVAECSGSGDHVPRSLVIVELANKKDREVFVRNSQLRANAFHNGANLC